MADFTQQVLSVSTSTLTRDGHTQQQVEIGGGGAAPISFKMRGRDAGRAPGSDYIIWVFTGDEPDFAGTGFAGGDPTPIGALIVNSVVNLGELG